MITICSGWRDKDGRRVHEGEKVLVPEDGGRPGISHGICLPCRDAFLERAAEAAKERAHADASS